MSFSLSGLASALATAVSTAEATVTVAEDVYTFGATMIDAAESAYSSTSGSGATKKAAVMAALAAFVAALGQDFSKIEAELSAWIDMVIAAYRSIVASLTTSPAPVASLSTSASTSVAPAAAVVTSGINTAGV